MYKEERLVTDHARQECGVHNQSILSFIQQVQDDDFIYVLLLVV